jgi:hypothetical protein
MNSEANARNAISHRLAFLKGIPSSENCHDFFIDEGGNFTWYSGYCRRDGKMLILSFRATGNYQWSAWAKVDDDFTVTELIDKPLPAIIEDIYISSHSIGRLHQRRSLNRCLIDDAPSLMKNLIYTNSNNSTPIQQSYYEGSTGYMIQIPGSGAIGCFVFEEHDKSLRMITSLSISQSLQHAISTNPSRCNGIA